MCNCKVRHLRSVLLPNLNRTTRWPLAVETVAGSESGAGVSGKGETALQNPVTGLCRALCLLHTKRASLRVDKERKGSRCCTGQPATTTWLVWGRGKSKPTSGLQPMFSRTSISYAHTILVHWQSPAPATICIPVPTRTGPSMWDIVWGLFWISKTCRAQRLRSICTICASTK